MKDLNERIIDILVKIKPSVKSQLDQRFVSEGILDSLHIMNLIMELETEFDIEIDPYDVLSENFESVQSIEALIGRCKGK